MTIDGRIVKLGGTKGVDRQLVLTSLRKCNSVAVSNSHAPSSLTTYTSAWNSWQRCARFFKFDPHCQSAAGQLSVEMCVNLLELYVGYECELRQLSPNSIERTYIPDIACMLERLHIFSNFRAASNHRFIWILLGGFHRMWGKRHPACDQVKIPFALTLALHAEQLLRSGAVTSAGLRSSGDSRTASWTGCV